MFSNFVAFSQYLNFILKSNQHKQEVVFDEIKVDKWHNDEWKGNKTFLEATSFKRSFSLKNNEYKQQGVVSYNAASVYLMTSKKPKEIKGVKW